MSPGTIWEMRWQLSIEGNSHYNPIASNDTEDGRAKNRRVEITITGRAN